MRLTARDFDARDATVRLDGRVLTNATIADDRQGFVEIVRIVEGKVVPNASGLGPQIDRLYGRVTISLHRSTRRRLQVHVPSFVRIARRSS